MEDSLENLRQKEQEQSGSGDIIAIFLGFYLLILAFFILLVSISTLEETKAVAVMDGLSSTFTSLLRPRRSTDVFTSKEGRIVTAQWFQEQVLGVFASTLQVAKVEIVQPGRLMRVFVPSNSLFHVGEARIRDSQYLLLDRIITSISGRPPGLRYELEFIIGSKSEKGRRLPTFQTLEMSRAGSFARQMLSRGAPPDSISVGLKPGDPAEIVILFWVREAGEGRTRINFLGKKKEEKSNTPTKSRNAPPPPVLSEGAGQPAGQ